MPFRTKVPLISETPTWAWAEAVLPVPGTGFGPSEGGQEGRLLLGRVWDGNLVLHFRGPRRILDAQVVLDGLRISGSDALARADHRLCMSGSYVSFTATRCICVFVW